MLYFKNYQLAELYPVSEKAIRNWITSAREGKLDLLLHEDADKFYIANTTKNQRVIKELVEKRKKFTNSRGHKKITPAPEFYQVYDKTEILDMISSIEAYHEVPFQYSYFNGGAQHWDTYAQRLADEDTPNTLNQIVQLLETNTDNIDRLLGSHKYVNVIDLGIGNALPSKNLLEHLLQKGVLNKYIGVDISKAMLEIAERNVKSWFGDKVPFEKYARNINYDNFRDIIADNYFGSNEEDRPLNLVLFLGGTLSNLREPNDALRAINNSMNLADRLIFSYKLDTSNSRRYFDFRTDPNQSLNPKLELMLRLLNIDKANYEIEQAFDENENMRFVRIRLKIALSIEFKLNNDTYGVNLNKDDCILLWRARHATAPSLTQQFEANGFDTLESSITNDHEYFLSISEIHSNK
jgi:uncharacterized SAM-dependent methyltransferase